MESPSCSFVTDIWTKSLTASCTNWTASSKLFAEGKIGDDDDDESRVGLAASDWMP